MSSHDLLKTKGRVNNKEFLMIIDSGASISVMELKTADQLELSVGKTRKFMKIVDGSLKKARSLTETVEVSVAGHACKIQFLVMDQHGYEILLGLEYFKKIDSGIYAKDKMIKFLDETIYLKDKDQESIPITSICYNDMSKYEIVDTEKS